MRFEPSNACCIAVPSRNQTAVFHALYDKVARSDVRWRAWGEVRANRGAPRIDGVSVDEVEESGVGEFLDGSPRRCGPGPTGPSPYDGSTSPNRASRARPGRSVSPPWVTGWLWQPPRSSSNRSSRPISGR